MLGALRHRNYRLFLTGQIISTIGTWMQSVAMPWLALQLTHSGLLVGLVLAVQFTPVLLGSQFGGIVADRYRKRRILLMTQSAFTIPSFTLFLLSSTRPRPVLGGLVAAAATGTINLFDVPARQSFLVEMVGKQDLMNAIALNSSVFNGAAVIGPSIAGVVIGVVGVPICFLANSLSYLGRGRRAAAHAQPADRGPRKARSALVETRGRWLLLCATRASASGCCWSWSRSSRCSL